MKNLTETPHGRRAADIKHAVALLHGIERENVAKGLDLLVRALHAAAVTNGNRPTVDRLNRLATEFSLLANTVRS